MARRFSCQGMLRASSMERQLMKRTVLIRGKPLTIRQPPVSDEDKKLAADWLAAIPTAEFEEHWDEPLPMEQLYKYAAGKKGRLSVDDMVSLDNALRVVVRERFQSAMVECVREARSKSG